MCEFFVPVDDNRKHVFLSRGGLPLTKSEATATYSASHKKKELKESHP